MADGVRDELLMMFDDANLLVRRALTLEEICAYYKFQPLDGALMPALGAAVLAAEAAHAAYEEFSAALTVQTGDAGEGAAALSPAEPLKVAA